ncbi:MAG: aspartate aminotransferase family protein [Bacteroidia bacterium]|nr:aspartate aminotransferase family protein [Bacteroidia bacterium]
MSAAREIFLRYLAPTSTAPLMLEIESAEGSIITDTSGKKYIDLISGISVSSLGHNHTEIKKAIIRQLDKHAHVMVYGEFIQAPQNNLAELLCSLLPSTLNSCYFVNSGTEAIEGALKLARRFTGRYEIMAFRNAYHGSTAGALSLMSNSYFKDAFRPLVPGIKWIDFGNASHLKLITENTAAIVTEFVQAEAGALTAEDSFFAALKKRCDETGTLLIADEIQTGMRRTGKLFAFEHYGTVPDVLVLAKAFGGGMPLGAFIAGRKIMQTLSENPPLGHITTFGGHPVCCAAAEASLKIISAISEKEIYERENLIRQMLVHPSIINISGKGLLLGIEFENTEICQQVIKQCILNGIITDWFLFAPKKLRIAPPLNISLHEIQTACKIILSSVNTVTSKT